MAKVDVSMLRDTWARFGADSAATWAAAIAYSTVFAIAPLLIVAIGIAGSVLGLATGGHQHHVVEAQLVGALQGPLGPEGAKSIKDLVDKSFASHSGSVIAQIIGWITFILAASGLFSALQGALNAVWHVKPEKRGLWLTIRERAASAAMLVVIGFLILVTTALNFVLSFLWTHFTQLLPFPGAGIGASVLNWIVEIAIISVMFGLMFKYLPDTEIAWSDVKVGALFSGTLFVVGQALLAIYLSHAGIANGYGAAGSLVVLLVWVYYSAMLLLLGAEFTQVWAERHGSRIGAPVPREDAAATVPSVKGDLAAPATAGSRSR